MQYTRLSSISSIPCCTTTDCGNARLASLQRTTNRTGAVGEPARGALLEGSWPASVATEPHCDRAAGRQIDKEWLFILHFFGDR
jgi:hypothetical protein